MDVLAGYLQVLVQIAVALYVVVVVAAAIVVRIAGVLVEHHCGGGLLFELAMVVATPPAAPAATTPLAAPPLPGGGCRSARTLIINGACTLPARLGCGGAGGDFPAGFLFGFGLWHLPGIQLILRLFFGSLATDSSFQFRGRPAICQEAPAYGGGGTGILRQLRAAQGSLRALALQGASLFGGHVFGPIEYGGQRSQLAVGTTGVQSPQGYGGVAGMAVLGQQAPLTPVVFFHQS